MATYGSYESGSTTQQGLLEFDFICDNLKLHQKVVFALAVSEIGPESKEI
jgi:hypothetical protein